MLSWYASDAKGGFCGHTSSPSVLLFRVREPPNHSGATDLFVSGRRSGRPMQNLEREIGQTLFRNEANKLVATSYQRFVRRCGRAVLRRARARCRGHEGKTLLRVGSAQHEHRVQYEGGAPDDIREPEVRLPENVAVEFVSDSCDELRRKVLGESSYARFCLPPGSTRPFRRVPLEEAASTSWSTRPPAHVEGIRFALSDMRPPVRDPGERLRHPRSYGHGVLEAGVSPGRDPQHTSPSVVRQPRLRERRFRRHLRGLRG